MLITDEQEVADKFNDYFINKITTLKEGIDKSKMVEPLETLKAKMAKKNLKFSLKTVSKKQSKK